MLFGEIVLSMFRRHHFLILTYAPSTIISLPKLDEAVMIVIT